MKNFFLHFSLLLASTHGVAQDVFVDTESIEVRESANDNSKTVGNLLRGHKIDITDIEVTAGKIWYKISEPPGWVISEQTCNDADCWKAAPHEAAALTQAAPQRPSPTPRRLVAEDQSANSKTTSGVTAETIREILSSQFGADESDGRFLVSAADRVEVFPPVLPNEIEHVIRAEAMRDFVSTTLSILALTELKQVHISATPRITAGPRKSALLNDYRVRATIRREHVIGMVSVFYPNQPLSILLGNDSLFQGSAHPGWSESARKLLYSDEQPGLKASYYELIRQSRTR